VISASVNGNTTRMALERLPLDVQRYGVTILVVTVGMNDCNYWLTDDGLPRVQPDAYWANLREFLFRWRHFGARRVLVPTNHPTPLTVAHPYAPRSYEENRRAYSQIVREVVSGIDFARLIDMEAVFDHCCASPLDIRDYLMPDGIHLGGKGHELYYSTFWPAIRQELAGLGTA